MNHGREEPVASQIMVVEPASGAGRGVWRLLAAHGYRSECVESGVAARSVARHDRFALVIIDLPGPSGMSLIDRLGPANPRTRFVLVTDAPDLDLIADCQHASAIVSVVHRPWDDDDLLEIIRQALAIDSGPVTTGRATAPCTALIIEDNDGDGDLIREYLAEAGAYHVERAQRLDEAIEMLERHPVDVVLTDLSLPDAAGLDSVRRLARHTPRSALLVLSGLANEELALQAVQIGAQDYLVKGQITAPLLHRAIRHARERKHAELALSRQAHNDYLTGLPNRVAFQDHIERAIARATRRRTQFAAMYVDVDGFKRVNDTYGHEAGDLVLVEVARRLSVSVRPSDVIARLGGDEFAALVDDTHGATSAIVVAQRMLMQMAVPIELRGADVALAVSIGISLFPSAGNDYNGLLAAADEAMYAAKNLGGHSYEVSDRMVGQV